jgi:hypothetical protein
VATVQDSRNPVVEQDPEPPRPRFTPVAFVLVTAVATALTWLRLPAVGRDTLYAEDGSQFVNDWAHDGSWSVLFKPYAGYQHLVPRAATGLVTRLLPVDAWADGAIVAAAFVVGVTSGLVFVLSRSVVSSRTARLGLAAVPVLVPLAGVEVIDSLANVHWYLLYLTPWLLLARPRGRATAVGLGAVALVSALTEPQTILFAPVALWVLLRDPRARVVVAGWALGVAGQVVTFVLAPRPRNDGFPPWLSVVKGYLASAVLASGNGHGRVVGTAVAKGGWWVGLAVLLVFWALAAVALIRASAPLRIAVLACVVGSVLAWVLPYVTNNASDLYYDEVPGPPYILPLVRWGMTASMLLLALVPLAAGALRARRVRGGRLLGLLLVGGLVVVMGASFLMDNDGRQGPYWRDGVSNARKQCANGSADVVRIPTGGTVYAVQMPCDRLGSGR